MFLPCNLLTYIFSLFFRFTIKLRHAWNAWSRGQVLKQTTLFTSAEHSEGDLSLRRKKHENDFSGQAPWLSLGVHTREMVFRLPRGYRVLFHTIGHQIFLKNPFSKLSSVKNLKSLDFYWSCLSALNVSVRLDLIKCVLLPDNLWQNRCIFLCKMR